MNIGLLVLCFNLITFLPVISQIDTFFLKKIKEINSEFKKRVKSKPNDCFYDSAVDTLKKEKKAMFLIMKLHFEKLLKCCQLVIDDEGKYQSSSEKKYEQEVNIIKQEYQKKIDSIDCASSQIKKYSRLVYVQVRANIWKQSFYDFEEYVSLLKKHMHVLNSNLCQNTEIKKRFSRSKSKPILRRNKEGGMYKKLSSSSAKIGKEFSYQWHNLDKYYFK